MPRVPIWLKRQQRRTHEYRTCHRDSAEPGRHRCGRPGRHERFLRRGPVAGSAGRAWRPGAAGTRYAAPCRTAASARPAAWRAAQRRAVPHRPAAARPGEPGHRGGLGSHQRPPTCSPAAPIIWSPRRSTSTIPRGNGVGVVRRPAARGVVLAGRTSPDGHPVAGSVRLSGRAPAQPGQGVPGHGPGSARPAAGCDCGRARPSQGGQHRTGQKTSTSTLSASTSPPRCTGPCSSRPAAITTTWP